MDASAYLRKRLDRIRGSHGQELYQYIPANVVTNERSAIEYPRVKEGIYE